MLADINAFWIGRSLGPIHAACLSSFVRVGHHVRLHVYRPPEDVPPGIELADAGEVVPQGLMEQRAARGGPAYASDFFRLELQAAERGLYVDCDCYCIRPIEDEDCILGWQDSQTIATAVMKIPAGSALLDDLRHAASMKGFIPPWVRPSVKRRYRLRAAVGLPVKTWNMEWGTIGPLALTHYVGVHGMADRVKPSDVFCPVHWSHSGRLFDPDLVLDELITSRTRIVHLWSETVRRSGLLPGDTSPIAAIIDTESQPSATPRAAE